MLTNKEVGTSVAARPADDVPVQARWPWLTPRWVIVFTMAWLGLFSLGSLFVANPFASETSAAAEPDYWHVMYLHGLLIGLAGLAALLTCQVFSLRSRHVRLWILTGVVFATVTTAIGGIFDTRVPGAEVAMWTQILGFFALDEILAVLLWGLWRERPREVGAKRVAFFAAFLAAGSMLVAALMGHLAGWILEFGDRPGVIARYVTWIGVKPADFTANLIGSHSHDMAVAVMALITVIAVQQFGLGNLTGVTRRVALGAVLWLAAGVVVSTVAYVAMAVSAWAPPTLFSSAGGTNGVAGDDILTGLTVMLGGLVALGCVAYGGRGNLAGWRRRPLPIAAAGAWAASFATMVVAGYAIELNETYFGAGDTAPGAAKDAVFTWLHQDIGLFLLPGLVLIAVVTFRMVRQARHALVGWLIAAGVVLTLIGALVYVFLDPALHGPGYLLSTAGLVTVAAGLVVAWVGVLTSRPPHSEQHPRSVPATVVLPARVGDIERPTAQAQQPASVPKPRTAPTPRPVQHV